MSGDEKLGGEILLQPGQETVLGCPRCTSIHFLTTDEPNVFQCKDCDGFIVLHLPESVTLAVTKEPTQ